MSNSGVYGAINNIDDNENYLRKVNKALMLYFKINTDNKLLNTHVSETEYFNII
ncbi:MAG: hypothetical protein LBU40_00055 [Methanobrevibacter sp.]|jgi:hypothetical protein|nr:hypothetical protein [Methanobrevibacter sp.]